MEPNSYRDKCVQRVVVNTHFAKEGLASKILQDSGEAGSQNSHISRGLHLLMTS